MAPGKKNQKDTHVLMELMPIESKEIETEVKECSVCVIREEATIGQNRIVINLDKKTTLMKLYKIVAEKANYIVDSFMLSFLKPASDGKSEEEIVLTDSCETTLKKVIGDVRSKTNNFILKGKNGKNPLRRIQQATVSGNWQYTHICIETSRISMDFNIYVFNCFINWCFLFFNDF